MTRRDGTARWSTAYLRCVVAPDLGATGKGGGACRSADVSMTSAGLLTKGKRVSGIRDKGKEYKAER
jgi:hypothetical protein